MLKGTLLNLLAGAMATTAVAQINMVNTSNVQYAHMGESVAQYAGFSLFGAYEDGTQTSSGAKYYEGAVYLYNNNGTQVRKYLLTDSLNMYANTGRSVALNSSFLAASVTGVNITNKPRGVVYIAGKTNGNWDNFYKYQIIDPQVNVSSEMQVALDDFGTLAIGSPDAIVNGVQSGAVYIYQFNGSAWPRIQVITPSNPVNGGKFGRAIAFNGGKLAVGAPETNGGRFYTYTKNGNAWSLLTVFPSNATPAAGAELGMKVDISENTAIVSAPNYARGSGAVLFLELQNNNWVVSSEFLNVKASSVAIENSTAVVGNSNETTTFFVKEWNGWKLKKTRVTNEPGDAFGYDVDIQGGKALVSRKYADKNGIPNVGAAVLYDFWSTVNSNTREDVFANDEVGYTNNLFPNPVLSASHVMYDSKDEILDVVAYSQDGSVSDLTVNAGKIDVSSLVPGVYTLRITTINGIENKKLSVQ